MLAIGVFSNVDNYEDLARNAKDGGVHEETINSYSLIIYQIEEGRHSLLDFDFNDLEPDSCDFVGQQALEVLEAGGGDDSGFIKA